MIDSGKRFYGIYIDKLNEVTRVEDIKKVETSV